jgi:hypothetical protein
MLTLKQRRHILDPGAVPGDSTIDTLFKKEHCSGPGQRNLLFEVGSVSLMGSKLGSTGVKVKWS